MNISVNHKLEKNVLLLYQSVHPYPLWVDSEAQSSPLLKVTQFDVPLPPCGEIWGFSQRLTRFYVETFSDTAFSFPFVS